MGKPLIKIIRMQAYKSIRQWIIIKLGHLQPSFQTSSLIMIMTILILAQLLLHPLYRTMHH